MKYIIGQKYVHYWSGNYFSVVKFINQYTFQFIIVDEKQLSTYEKETRCSTIVVNYDSFKPCTKLFELFYME